MRKSAWTVFRLAISFFAISFIHHLISCHPCLASADDKKETSVLQEEFQTSEEKQENKKQSEGLFDFELRDELQISAESVNQLSEDEFLFEGDVDMISGESRIQADRIYLNNKTQKVEAEGSVLLDWGQNRLAGERLEFDIETENGTMTSVLGYIEPEYLFRAEKVEKIAKDKIIIYKAVFTSCTQPTPYWSFKMSRALIHIDHYAYLRNILFKVGKVPLIYLPYLIWPVKEERSAGLLFPEIGSTKNRGKVISEAFFWPIRRNMDMTIYADYYSLAGTAGGVEYNFIPNKQGRGRFLGYYLDDKTTDSKRYRFNYSQEQNFNNGFRLYAEINEISDFNYYTDFERELKYSSQPFSLSRVDLSRNWSHYSLNIREEWREQRLVLGKLTQSQLPEIELRGRSQKLGNTPFYLTFETSFINFSKESKTLNPLFEEVTSYDADYMRYDLSPTISLPYSPSPWLDLDFSMLFRETFYTKKLDPENLSIVLDETLNRFLAGGRIEIIGPKFYRIYDRPESEFSPRYKHTIEPRINYFYMPTFDQQNEVPKFDEIDFVGGGHQVTFILRNALYAKRPSGPLASFQEEGEVSLKEGEIYEEAKGEKEVRGKSLGMEPLKEEMLRAQEGREIEGDQGGEHNGEEKMEKTLNPVEIGSFEVSQSYSFDFPLSFGKGETKNYSPIVATFRFNPSSNYSFDLKTKYDLIFQSFSSTSISASLKKEEIGYMTLSMVSMKDFVGSNDREQVTFEGGARLFHQKFGFNVKLSYDISKSFLPEQRYRIEYYTQCCGFYFEYLNRDFSFNERREFRFTIDLKGIGKVLDFHHGYTE